MFYVSFSLLHICHQQNAAASCFLQITTPSELVDPVAILIDNVSLTSMCYQSFRPIQLYTCTFLRRMEFCYVTADTQSKLVMGWVHPWVGLGWVGWRLDCVIFFTS